MSMHGQVRQLTLRFGGLRVLVPESDTRAKKWRRGSCMLSAGRRCRFILRPSYITRHLSTALRRSLITMAEVASPSLDTQLAEQTALVNKLRLENPGTDLYKEASKKLGELKKALALQQNATDGGKEAAKKKERLLLKTAKVPPRIRSDICLRS